MSAHDNCPTRARVDEPMLELEQIQGIAVPGFLKPCQSLITVRHGDGEAQVRAVRWLLQQWLPSISSGVAALEDRERFRLGKVQDPSDPPLMAIAFTWPGLRSLTESADRIRSPAFRLGLSARSGLLGAPVNPGEAGHPSTWVVGGPDDTPDFMVVIAGDHPEQVDRRASIVTSQIEAAGFRALRQDGEKLGGASQSREHFGFVDGISQPGIRGQASQSPGTFVTPSRIATWPASALYGHPGQTLVWPGEFVLGYPRTGPDPLMPGPIAQPDLDWMKNGSYLVYNRLRQNVGLFWRTMREQAAQLSSTGFGSIGEDELAARLVGRTRSGAPISRPRLRPDDDVELGRNPYANNHFRFDSDTPTFQLLDGVDPYPPARADPLGRMCPFAAHIRKVNPRDSASDMGGESANEQHRILRIGVSFGPERVDLKADPREDEPERGQLFLCIQASIEQQFEFLQARWMNDDMRPKSPGGHDMLAGRQSLVNGGARHCTIFGANGQGGRVEARENFVVLSGGGYFFVPSLDAIRKVLAPQ